MAIKDLISKIIIEDEFSDAFDEYENRLGDAEKAQSGFGKGLTKALGGIGAVAGPAGAVVAAAGGTMAAGVGLATKEVIDFGNQTNRAMELFQQQTGAANGEMSDFRDIALGIFEANWGESIEDVAGAMAQVKNTTGATGDELEQLTTNALVLRDRFGKDVTESIDAAKVLMDEFGLSNEQAFDFMVAGAQRGLDRNGDLLDSIREYGNQFGDAGFSAEQFFSVLESGAEGGVLGTDKVADAIKEFQIRANEGSDEVRESFGAIGLDFDAVAAQVSNGQATWADFFEQVITGLNGIEDPIARSQVQVGLFGTQAEDLGGSFTTGLSTASTSLTDIEGSLNAAATSSTDLGTRVDEMWRKFLVGAEPIAQEILPLFNQGLDAGLQFMERAQPIFAQFADDLGQNLGPAMLAIEDAAIRIAQALGLATEDTTGMDLAIGALKTGLDLAVTTIQAVAVGAQTLANIVEGVTGRINTLTDRTSSLTEKLRAFIELASPLGFLSDVGGALGFDIPGFAGGGTVPGPIGQPRLVMAHGGETIRNPQQEAALPNGGQQTINNYLTVNAQNGDPYSRAGAMRTGRTVLNALNGLA